MIKQQMGEKSWRELMQNLGHFVTVADQLIDQNYIDKTEHLALRQRE